MVITATLICIQCSVSFCFVFTESELSSVLLRRISQLTHKICIICCNFFIYTYTGACADVHITDVSSAIPLIRILLQGELNGGRKQAESKDESSESGPVLTRGIVLTSFWGRSLVFSGYIKAGRFPFINR